MMGSPETNPSAGNLRMIGKILAVSGFVLTGFAMALQLQEFADPFEEAPDARSPCIAGAG
jgi:hypothetical protein